MNTEQLVVVITVTAIPALILFDCFVGEVMVRWKGLEYRIKEVVDSEIGNYYVINEKHLFWWRQTEPGFHYTRESAECRLNYLKSFNET